MASKDRPAKDSRTHSPELEPYAPPHHPDVNVPEQQFEGNPRKPQKADREQRARPK